MALRLTILLRGSRRGLAEREFRRRARAIFEALELGEAELSVLLTTDAHIRWLNRTYRKKDRPTDVLAFAMREGELGDMGGAVLGDVVISVETARRQAEKAGHPLLAEMTMLLAHGVLHLLGWDHDTDAKDRRMRAETARLVELASALPSKRAARSRKTQTSRESR